MATKHRKRQPEPRERRTPLPRPRPAPLPARRLWRAPPRRCGEQFRRSGHQARRYPASGLLLGALALAYLLPFELLVLSYTVLGPAHYLTEISWLHDRKYFLPHRGIALLLALVRARRHVHGGSILAWRPDHLLLRRLRHFGGGAKPAGRPGVPGHRCHLLRAAEPARGALWTRLGAAADRHSCIGLHPDLHDRGGLQIEERRAIWSDRDLSFGDRAHSPAAAIRDDGHPSAG